jgi:hypothetical protein
MRRLIVLSVCWCVGCGWAEPKPPAPAPRAVPVQSARPAAPPSAAVQVPRAEPPAAPATPASPAARPAAVGYRARDVERAIRAAVAHFRSRGDAIDPMIALLLDRITRSYRLDLAWNPVRRAAYRRERGAEFLRAFALLGFPSEALSLAELERTLARWDSPTDKQMLTAAYCRQLAKAGRPVAGPILVAGDGYAATHNLLATQLLHDLRCISAAAAQAALREQLPSTAALVDSKLELSDLALEALAVRRHVQPQLAPSQAWLDTLLAGQSSDGAWLSEEHATLLALWILLQHSAPTIRVRLAI